MSLSHRELEDLKPLLSETVRKQLGFTEPTVVAAALNCISTGLDKRKTIDKLSLILEGKQAVSLADQVHNVYEDYRTSGRKRKKRDIESEESKRRRYLDDEMLDMSSIQQAARPINTLPNIASQQLTPDKIKEMMANAQKMIQERKAQLQVSMTPAQPRFSMQQQARARMPMGDQKAKRAAELQAQIQARLSGLAGQLPTPLMGGIAGGMYGHPGNHAGRGMQADAANVPPQNKEALAGPSPLILNEEGKTIDAKTGEAVQLALYTPTLKANIRAKRREQFKGIIERAPEEISESKFFDPRVSLKGIQRPRRGFKFHEKGKFESQAQRLRAKAQLERLQTEISQAARRTGIASAAKIATITPKKEIKEGEVPDMEWWDTFILKTDNYAGAFMQGEISRDYLDGITHLVEHPTQIQPPVNIEKEPVIPVYLTKKERKKLRRQNRREAEKEIQEKIRLGLAPPLEPKVRMANLMRVLGTEAVQDPTKVEAHVRAQMAKRQRAHEEANAARKLTVEQRRDKRISKIKEDTTTGVLVNIYRIRDLSDAAIKFKVEKNASQLYMTGIAVLYKDCNLVVVEGGPKQQRKFKRLMLHRIKWETAHRRGAKDKVDDSDDEAEEEKVNKCVLVWEGMVKTRSFSELRFKVCPTETFAREQLRKCGVEHYWDVAYSGTVLETAGDE